MNCRGLPSKGRMEEVLPRRVFAKAVDRKEERTGRHLASVRGEAQEEMQTVPHPAIGREAVLEEAQSPSLAWVVSCRLAIEVEDPAAAGMRVVHQIEAEPEECSCEHCDKDY